jgi:hypothetical protein
MTSKPVKLTTDAAIDAAKDFAQTRKQMQKDFALLQMKQAREINDFMAEYKKRFREQFRVAAADILPDPDEAFSAATHTLDVSYIEFGDAYLIRNPQLPDEGQGAEETTGDDTPARIIIN